MSSRSPSDRLVTYLDDHLAGANAGVRTARHLEKRVAGSSGAAALGRLAADVEQDREYLRRLVDRLGDGTHPLRRAAGRVVGTVHQLVVAPRPTRGGRQLGLVRLAETMALGVEGKRRLWQALLGVAPVRPELVEADLRRLVARADDQRERVETVRLVAVARAFGPSPVPTPGPA